MPSRKPPRVAALAALVAALASGGASAPPRVEADALMAVVRALADPEFAGRRAGTDGGRRARVFITRQLADAGLAPAFGASFEQPFDLPRRGRPRGGDRRAANAGGVLRGEDRAARSILVSAHYDHLGIRDGTLYPGADDNASGVAVLLAAARHFSAARPRHSMLFVAFDGEEDGLAGSREFVRRPPLPLARMAVIVNLDMLGRSDRREIVAAGAYHTPWLEPLLARAAKGAAITLRQGFDRPVPRGARGEDWTHASDHGPFHAAGVPFVYFGVEEHRDYHGPGDTADRLDPSFMAGAAGIVLETLRLLDRELE